VTYERLVAVIDDRRFELIGARIRAVERPSVAHPRVIPPDILYYAGTDAEIPQLAASGLGQPGESNRVVYLSEDEAQAWRVAHRLAGDGARGRVVVVDAARARRRGVRFYRNRRNGLFLVQHIAPPDLLNLQSEYAEQLSAGGIPFLFGPDGTIRFALIRVTRRSGVTWEVAKGKLEDGETPEAAGIREVREEMGLDIGLSVRASIGAVRYGFLAPGGLPRLKTVYLFLFACETEPGTFRPAEREGIGAVRWFTPDEAAKVVTHSSLLPAMRRARLIVEDWRP
jgi:8-oxo-dGTP diphosphatase